MGPPPSFRPYPENCGRQVGFHRPRRVSQECYRCGLVVTDIKKHVRRAHQKKFWGWKCPVCHHFEMDRDRNLMKAHLARHQPSPALESCAYNAQAGYMEAARCSVVSCHFKAESQFHLGIHAAAVHRGPPQVEAYFTAANAHMPVGQPPVKVGPGASQQAAERFMTTPPQLSWVQGASTRQPLGQLQVMPPQANLDALISAPSSRRPNPVPVKAPAALGTPAAAPPILTAALGTPIMKQLPPPPPWHLGKTHKRAEKAAPGPIITRRVASPPPPPPVVSPAPSPMDLSPTPMLSLPDLPELLMPPSETFDTNLDARIAAIMESQLDLHVQDMGKQTK